MTLNKMIEFLRQKHSMFLEDSEIEDYALPAIWWFCHDYHEGIGSHKYRILCEVEFKPRKLASSVEDEGEIVQDMYMDLEEEFSSYDSGGSNTTTDHICYEEDEFNMHEGYEPKEVWT